MKILPDRYNPFLRLLDRLGCTDGEKKYLSAGILNLSGSTALLYMVRPEPVPLSLAYLAVVLVNYKWVRLARKREECLNCGRVKLPSEMSEEQDEFGCPVCKRCCRRVETRKRIREQRISRTVHEQTSLRTWKAHPAPPPPLPSELFPSHPGFSQRRRQGAKGS